MINQRGRAGEKRALGYTEELDGQARTHSVALTSRPLQGSVAISMVTQRMISQPAWALMKALPHSSWTPGAQGTVQLP